MAVLDVDRWEEGSDLPRERVVMRKAQQANDILRQCPTKVNGLTRPLQLQNLTPVAEVRAANGVRFGLTIDDVVSDDDGHI